MSEESSAAIIKMLGYRERAPMMTTGTPLPQWFRTAIPADGRTTAFAPITDARIEIRVAFGTWIESAALAAQCVAIELNTPCTFEFNGQWLTAFPGQPFEEIVAIYAVKIGCTLEDLKGDVRRQAAEPSDG